MLILRDNNTEYMKSDLYVSFRTGTDLRDNNTSFLSTLFHEAFRTGADLRNINTVIITHYGTTTLGR